MSTGCTCRVFFLSALLYRFYGRNKAKVAAIFCGVVIIFGIMTGVRGRVWGSKFTLWNDVVKKYPNDPRAQVNLGTGYSELGMHEASVYYETLGVSMWEKRGHKNKQDLAAAYHNIGNAQITLGKLDLAEKNLIKAIEYKDDWAMLYCSLGTVYFKKGYYEKALKNFKRTIDLDPNYSNGHLNLASTCYILKKYDKALKAYDKAIRLNPGLSSVAYNAMGAIYRDKGSYKNALDYFKKALYYDPNNTRAQENLKNVEKLLR
jgi:tetratricopeptide (TPR) repeat protein